MKVKSWCLIGMALATTAILLKYTATKNYDSWTIGYNSGLFLVNAWVFILEMRS